MAETSHLFVVDPLKDLNLTLDSSVRMAAALAGRGHKIYFATIENVHLSRQHGPYAVAEQVTFSGDKEPSPVVSGSHRLPMSQMTAVHMRKDPPIDERYFAVTWILSRLPSHVRQYNNSEALRAINEKLSILDFPEDSDPCLVSGDPVEIHRFAMEHGAGDIIIKPLTLYGGRGVERIKCDEYDEAGLLSELRSLTEGGKSPRIVQPFNHAIFDGEIRVFCAFGEAITFCLKKPKKGEFLANTARGATLEDYVPSKKMLGRIEGIAKAMQSKGVYLTGFDVIGEKVSEINITSPRLLAKDLKPSYFERIALLMEQDLDKERRQ